MLPQPTPPPLSLALAGLSRDAGAPWAGGVRQAIAWASRLGVRAVQLDAAAALPHGVRARDLDRSSRRDLAALVRRSQLTLSGLDLWIPPEHFADPGRADRALEAALDALELAAQLASLIDGSAPPTLSLTLPESGGSLPQEMRLALLARAEATGTRIADHAIPSDSEERSDDPVSPLAIGIDPGALLLAGRDPARAVSRAGGRLASARLSDATTSVRAAPGSSGARLDQLAYLVALSTVSYERPIVLDLRGVSDQQAEAERIARDW